jgi:predicted neutral ceramidase superfamily lipid hydrolase
VPPHPAICSFCGRAFANKQGWQTILVLSVIFILIITCYVAYAYIYPSLLLMALPLLILVCSPVAFYLFVPLAPVTNEQSSTAKNIVAIAFVISIAYVIYNYITYE